jgi:hypothetical protein
MDSVCGVLRLGYASLRMTGGDKDNMDKRLKIIIIFFTADKAVFLCASRKQDLHSNLKFLNKK